MSALDDCFDLDLDFPFRSAKPGDACHRCGGADIAEEARMHRADRVLVRRVGQEHPRAHNVLHASTQLLDGLEGKRETPFGLRRCAAFGRAAVVLDRAGAGERVRVMNLSSRSTLFGTVTASGTVSVLGD